jgi:hypothetical protein
MVPPNWEHPKKEFFNREGYQPMVGRNYDITANEWLEECILWSKGIHPSQNPEYAFYWDYAGAPPNRKYYAHYKKEDCTWYQLYENVSEGTPVSPPFATKEELADYLEKNGNFWGESYTKESARRMCERGYVMSGMFIGGKFMAGTEALNIERKDG